MIIFLLDDSSDTSQTTIVEQLCNVNYIKVKINNNKILCPQVGDSKINF